MKWILRKIRVVQSYSMNNNFIFLRAFYPIYKSNSVTCVCLSVCVSVCHNL